MPMPVITTRRVAGSISTLDDMIVISFDRVSRNWRRAGNKSPGSARWTALNKLPASAFLSEEPSLAIAFQRPNRTPEDQPRNAVVPLHSTSWKASLRGRFRVTVSAERKLEDGETEVRRRVTTVSVADAQLAEHIFSSLLNSHHHTRKP